MSIVELIDFLNARLDDDEAYVDRVVDAELDELRLANAAPATREEIMEHRPDLRRALAEVEAKRRIIERHHPDSQLENWYWANRRCAECGNLWHKMLPDRPPTEIGPEVGCPTLRLLASIYSDRDGYREDWSA